MSIITQHHHLDAPPSTVFKALTDAQRLCSWWTTTAESDATIGGEFRYEFRHTPAALAEGKQDMVQEGRYIECDAGTVQFPWSVGPARSNVRFVLNIEGGGTDLKLTHSDVPDDEAIVKALGDGWTFSLGNLAAVLSGKPDGRAEAGLITGIPVAGSR